MSGEKRRACVNQTQKFRMRKKTARAALFLQPSKIIPFPLHAHLTTSLKLKYGGSMVDDRHLVTLLRRSSLPQSSLERIELASYPYRDTLPQWNVPEEQLPFAIEHFPFGIRWRRVDVTVRDLMFITSYAQPFCPRISCQASLSRNGVIFPNVTTLSIRPSYVHQAYLFPICSPVNKLMTQPQESDVCLFTGQILTRRRIRPFLPSPALTTQVEDLTLLPSSSPATLHKRLLFYPQTTL